MTYPALPVPEVGGTIPLHYGREKVIGERWNTLRAPGLAALAAGAKERHPCPVCGHPTGDCTIDHEMEKRHG